MEKILSVTSWSELPDYECLALFHAVTAPRKLWLKRKAPDVWRRQVYEEATFTDERSAERAGYEAGLAYKSMDLDAWCVGAWRRWAGVEGARLVKDPYANLERFVTAFRVAAPSNARLIYKGISSAHTNKGTGYRKLHDPLLMSQFDAVCTSNFGTDPAKIREWYRLRTFKYRPVVDCYPEFGCGRIDKHGDLWGNWHLTHRLLLDTKPSAVSFSFGEGARLQMRVGHPYHPPLVQCVKEIE